jgi:hypothetical protein
LGTPYHFPSESAVFHRRLFVMAALTERLPIPGIPENLHIAFMRKDVISDHRGSRKLLMLTKRINTQRMLD